MNNIKKGQIIKYEKAGIIQCGLVVQNDIGNKFSPTTIIINLIDLDNKVKLQKPYCIVKKGKIQYGVQLTNITVIDKKRILLDEDIHEISNKEKKNLNNLLKRLNTSKFDIIYINVKDYLGSEQGGQRPAIYLKNYNLACPITTKIKKVKNLPTHALINAGILKYDSMVMTEQIRAINEDEKDNTLGVIKDKELVSKINNSIQSAFF